MITTLTSYCKTLLVQGETILAENIALVETLIEPWFIFALIWSVGGTCDGHGRKKFNEYLRKKMDEEKVTVHFTLTVHLPTSIFSVKKIRIGLISGSFLPFTTKMRTWDVDFQF